VRTRGGRNELEEVIHGEEHQGPDPDLGIGGGVRRHAAAVDHEHAEVMAARRAARARPAFAAIGGTLGLVVCVWLLLAQWSVLGYPLLSDDTLARDTGVGIVAAFAAWRVLLAGPQRFTAVLLLVCGATFVVFGLTLDHLTRDGTVSETLSGCLLVVSGLLVLVDRALGRPPTGRAGR
jgi:hypothetical protein